MVTVKPNSAIDRLAYSVRDFNKHLDIKVLPVHPKKPDNLAEYKKLAEWADIIDYEYWKTAEMLRTKFLEFKNKPCILSHYNPYNIKESDWKEYQKIITCNLSIQKDLKESTGRKIEHIPLSVDLDFFTFADNYDPDIKRIVMVSQRIESKKGIREVAWACYQLNYEFVLIGAVSSGAYFDQIMAVNPKTQWMAWVSDEDLKEYYQNASVHICNSIDNFESGTMPVLEAMACGCPVMSREVGHISDISDGNNIEIYEEESEDKERLKACLKSFMEDKQKRLKMREKAWETVRNYSAKRRALRFAKIFNEVYFQQEKLVSIIIPTTYDRVRELETVLIALEKQTYKNIEVIVCFDEEEIEGGFNAIECSYPVKFIYTEKTEKYGLAKARNLGVIEAEGEYLVFCDSRLCPEEKAIESYIKVLSEKLNKTWLHGSKGNDKKSFVENWSAIKRQDLIDAGGFNERMSEYGGMTQELRSRFKKQGFDLVYCLEAKCFEIKSANKKNKEKRNSIIRMKDKLNRMNF